MTDLHASAGGWCAPADTIYDDYPPTPVTWLVDIGELVAMTEQDRAWLDAQWALANGEQR